MEGRHVHHSAECHDRRPARPGVPFLANPDNIPRWRPDVLKARSVSGPLHLGSEFDEVLNFGGRRTQTFHVDVFDAHKTLEAVAIAGLGIRPTQRYDLSDSNGETTVSIRITMRTQGFFRLLEPLLPKMIAAKWRDYGDRLRGLLENQPVVLSNETDSVLVGQSAQQRTSRRIGHALDRNHGDRVLPWGRPKSVGENVR